MQTASRRLSPEMSPPRREDLEKLAVSRLHWLHASLPWLRKLVALGALAFAGFAAYARRHELAQATQLLGRRGCCTGSSASGRSSRSAGLSGSALNWPSEAACMPGRIPGRCTPMAGTRARTPRERLIACCTPRHARVAISGVPAPAKAPAPVPWAMPDRRSRVRDYFHPDAHRRRRGGSGGGRAVTLHAAALVGHWVRHPGRRGQAAGNKPPRMCGPRQVMAQPAPGQAPVANGVTASGRRGRSPVPGTRAGVRGLRMRCRCCRVRCFNGPHDAIRCTWHAAGPADRSAGSRRRPPG